MQMDTQAIAMQRRALHGVVDVFVIHGTFFLVLTSVLKRDDQRMALASRLPALAPQTQGHTTLNSYKNM